MYPKKKLKLDYWSPAVLMCLMTIVVMIQVCLRIAGHPITWGEEIARWLLIWMVFTGLMYAFNDGGLISVDYFVKKLSPKRRKAVYYFNMGTTILYFAILFVSSIAYFVLLHNKGTVFPITKMPSTLTVVAELLGCILAIIFAVRQLFVIKKTNYAEEEKGIK